MTDTARPRIGKNSTSSSSDPLLAEFRGYLRIDKNGLDEAMAEQSDLFFRIGEAYADAASARDEAKEQLSTVDAKLGLRFRDAKNGDVKVTEGAVKDRIQQAPEHIEAFKRYNALKERAEKIVSMREAFQDRGRMLRDLGQLYAAGYFTTTATRTGAANVGRAMLAKTRGNG